MLDSRVGVQSVQRQRLSGDSQVHRGEGLRPSPMGYRIQAGLPAFLLTRRITQYLIFLYTFFCSVFCSLFSVFVRFFVCTFWFFYVLFVLSVYVLVLFCVARFSVLF